MKYDEIIEGDCLDVLPTIPDCSIDLLVTDPPYSIGTTSTGNKGDWLDNNLIRPFFSQWFQEVRRVLKDDGEFYINTDWRTYPFLYPIATTYLQIKNCIVWDYEWIKAGSHYRFSHEFILYGNKTEGQSRQFSASERDVWRIPPINFTSKSKLHQAQKPEALIRKMIINSSKEGDVVLDTFLGSGTTALVAASLGRRYIGIEINHKHYETAIQRLRLINTPLL